MTPSTDPIKVQAALERLVALMHEHDSHAEFPDVAWRVASASGVQYDALVDAYDDRLLAAFRVAAEETRFGRA